MAKIPLSYDLHMHSCLSPCGDDDMTPGNVVGMATIKELDVIALTDHNTCKNCEAAMKLGEAYGRIVIPGMELTTLEEVHVVCLFPNLEAAMEYDHYVYEHLLPIANREDIFGKQQIMNEDDEVIGTVENLLINATDISFDRVYDLLQNYNGVMIPAHIDKSANSMLSNLGMVPPDSKFITVEVKDMKRWHELQKKHPYFAQCNVITNSDAHYLEHMNEATNTIHVEEKSISGILNALRSSWISSL